MPWSQWEIEVGVLSMTSSKPIFIGPGSKPKTREKCIGRNAWETWRERQGENEGSYENLRTQREKGYLEGSSWCLAKAIYWWQRQIEPGTFQEEGLREEGKLYVCRLVRRSKRKGRTGWETPCARCTTGMNSVTTCLFMAGLWLDPRIPYMLF